MRAIQLFSRSIFIRELLPQDLKIELETLAPSWLWSSVVDLLAIHEKAYLER